MDGLPRLGEQLTTWGSDYPRVVPRKGFRDSLKDSLNFTKEHMPSCTREKFELVFGNTALSLSKLAQELTIFTLIPFFDSSR